MSRNRGFKLWLRVTDPRVAFCRPSFSVDGPKKSVTSVITDFPLAPSPTPFRPWAMQDSYPKFTRTDEKDPRVWKPRGWRGKFYKLFSSMRFVRKELHLSEDLFMVQTELLEGHIKVGGVIDPERLAIGFYESSVGARVSGKILKDQRMAVSYNGCKWDSVSKAPALGVAIHFSPTLTRRIVSPGAHAFLMDHRHASTGERLSLLSATSPAGEELSAAIRSSILWVEETENSPDNEMMLAWMSDDLISLAACLLDEMTETPGVSMTPGETSRYDIAREIENLLWRNPTTGGSPLSLHEMAEHFGCSPRHIQMALQEHFGVGLTALKRAIRLQQVNAALSSGVAYDDIISAALDHGFDHAVRFSRYYKEMFGELPSQSLRSGKQDRSVGGDEASR